MKIKFLGPIEAPPENVVARVEESFTGGSVRELLEALSFPSHMAHFLTVIRDQERLGAEDRVAATDQVTVMLLVGGG